jgi:signal transduction histidine kinase
MRRSVALRVLVCSVLLAGAPAARGQARPEAADDRAADGTAKRVLILQSFGSTFSPYNLFSSSFQSGLGARLNEPLEFHEIAVTALSSSEPEIESGLAVYLDALGTARPPDLAVVIGGQAGRFVMEHRQRLLASTPVLYAGVPLRLVPPDGLTENDAVVPFDIKIPALMENILQVLPNTETVAVVVGTSPLGRFWRGALGRELERYESDVRILWWDDLAAADVRRKAAALPPRSAILYTLFLVDGAGVPHANHEFLLSLRAEAGAPIFGVFDTQLGQGVVGGRLLPVAEASSLSVEAAAGILRGEPPAEFRLPPVALGPPAYDGRELERWGIRTRNLPPGSTVLFRPPPLWVAFRGPVLAALGVLAVLAGLVIALNLHRVRLVAAEREVRSLSHRLLTAIEQERRWLSRELHDDISQRLAALAIDAARLGCDPSSGAAPGSRIEDFREGIASLSVDVHALSHWLHPSLLDDVGLVEALRSEVGRFSKAESIPVELSLDEPVPELPPETALCLYRVAQEALQNIAHHAAAGTVLVSLRPKMRGCELEVRDDGVGFDPERRPRSGLGLASMTERVRLVGGRLRIDSAPQRGAAVVAWVPLGPGGQT